MHRLLFLLACAARPGLAFHVPGSRVRPLGGARALRMSVLDGPGEVLGTITRKATDALTSPPAVELGTYALKVALQWAIPTAVIVIGVLAVSGGGDDDAKPSGSSSSGLAPKAKGLRKLFGLPYGSLKKVQQVDESTALFLFNHTTKVMHGVYICDGRGGLNLEPDAWAHHRKNPTERTSPYPAQIRSLCTPLQLTSLPRKIPLQLLSPWCATSVFFPHLRTRAAR